MFKIKIFCPFAASNKCKEIYERINYANEIDFYGENKKIAVNEIKSEPKLLIAGIAKPTPFFDYLKNENDECMTFPDHHNFSDSDLETIQSKAQNKKIVTTEKDYVRLKDSKLASQLYYLPIKSTFINNHQNFDASILEYVKLN